MKPLISLEDKSWLAGHERTTAIKKKTSITAAESSGKCFLTTTTQKLWSRVTQG